MNDSDADSSFASFEGASCLVTGGAGFIGSNLTRALARLGARVTVFDDLSTGKLENIQDLPGIEFVTGDVSHGAELEQIIPQCNYIFHMAAQVGNIKSIDRPVEDAMTNVIGTTRILKIASGSQVRKIVYSSSSAIFGEARTLPIDEDHAQDPASFYALSKMTGEKYCLLAASLWSLPVTCLRYFNVYGFPSEDSDYSGVISIFFRRLAEGKPLLIYGDGRQSRDFVYVLDVVQALLRAAVHGQAGRVYNIGSGRATDLDLLARTVCEVAGSTSTEISHHPPRAGEVRHSVADISRARRELGYEPEYDLARGLEETWRAVHGSEANPPAP